LSFRRQHGWFHVAVNKSPPKIQQLGSPVRPDAVAVSTTERRLDDAEKTPSARNAHIAAATATAHFTAGSAIDIGGGEWKPIEGLRTDDFVRSVETSADLRLNTSIVIRMEHDHERNMAVLGFAVGRHRVEVCLVKSRRFVLAEALVCIAEAVRIIEIKMGI
jgi:Ataxin-1 and HBP1 module (AXH)